MKAISLFALFLFVGAAAGGCQDKEMAAPGGAPLNEPRPREQPSTQPAEDATTQPSVAEAPRRVLWWGDPSPVAQGAGSTTSPEAGPSTQPSASVDTPTDGQ